MKTEKNSSQSTQAATTYKGRPQLKTYAGAKVHQFAPTVVNAYLDWLEADDALLAYCGDENQWKDLPEKEQLAATKALRDTANLKKREYEGLAKSSGYNEQKLSVRFYELRGELNQLVRLRRLVRQREQNYPVYSVEGPG